MTSTNLSFNNTNFSIVDHNGQVWLRSAELAEALGYADDRSVSRIYARNSDEFTDSMSTVVKLTTSANLKAEMRIYSLRGAHLVAMFARTDIAKKFRKWVLDVLDREQAKINGVRQDRMTDEQVGYIYNSVMRICGETGQTYQALFGMLKREFQVASYKHIKAVDFPHACEVLGVPVPVFTSRAQQAIEHQEHYGYLNEIDAWNTINLWFRLKNLSEFMQDHMLPVLKKLDSGLCGRAYSLTHDPIMTLTLTEDCLLDLSKQFQQLDNKGMDWNERVSNIKNCTFKRLT
ncbi:BRO family protein [Oligella sp. HMSC09E12]|nr:BRO family protein [Oligella sp. HMSC09E12]